MPQSLHGCLILLSFLLLQDHEPSLSIGRLQNLACFNINGLSIDNKNSVTSKAHLFHMSEIPILLSLPCKVFNLWYSNIFSNVNRPTSLKGVGGEGGGGTRSQVWQMVWTIILPFLQKLLFPDDEFWNNQLSSLTSRLLTIPILVRLSSRLCMCLLNNKKTPRG